MAGHTCKFLRMVALGANHPLPGLGAKADQEAIRPLFSHTLLVNLNRELHSTAWALSSQTVRHDPEWRRADLRRKIQARQTWPGTEPQLNDTLEKFISHGFLGESQTSIWATSKLIDYLIDHAKLYYKSLVNENLPSEWNANNRAWIDFNQLIFDFFFSRIGPEWRDIRGLVNDTFIRHKRLKRHSDTVGSDPAYYVVLNMIGIHANVDQWDLTSKIKELGLNALAGSPQNVFATVDELLKVGMASTNEDRIIVKDENLAKLFSRYIETISTELSKLENALFEWRAKT